MLQSKLTFAAIVEGDTYNELYDRVRSVISNNSANYIWIPSKDKL